MEPVEAARYLWSRKLLVGLVLALATLAAILSAYRISLSPPGLESRSLQVGAASSQILIDSPRSTAIAGEASLGTFEALAIRAKIYGQYLSSLEARQRIAEYAGIPARSISTSGPFSAGRTEYEAQSSEDRANEILKEGAQNRLVFTAQESVPILTVDAQASSAELAVALANGSFATLEKYVNDLQVDGEDANRGVTVRELGAPEGGVIGGGNDVILMALAFLAVAGLGFAAILLFPRFAQRWRVLNQAEGTGSVEQPPISSFENPYAAPEPEHHSSHGYDQTPLTGSEHQTPVAPQAAHLR